MSTAEDKIVFLGVKIGELRARLDTFSSETAEWIGELQAEDARLGARIKELEDQVKDLYGIYEAREERLNVMGRRIKELEKRVAGNHWQQHIELRDEVKDLYDNVLALEQWMKAGPGPMQRFYVAKQERDALAKRVADNEECISLLEITKNLHSQRLPDLSLKGTQIVVDGEWVAVLELEKLKEVR